MVLSSGCSLSSEPVSQKGQNGAIMLIGTSHGQCVPACFIFDGAFYTMEPHPRQLEGRHYYCTINFL